MCVCLCFGAFVGVDNELYKMHGTYIRVYFASNTWGQFKSNEIMRISNWIGHMLLGNCLLNRLLKEMWEEKEDVISSFWTTLRKRKDSGT